MALRKRVHTLRGEGRMKLGIPLKRVSRSQPRRKARRRGGWG